jgi:hypothetical protein
LAINGTTATLTVNNTWSISTTYVARQIQGTNVNLNYGIVGLGTNNSKATYGDTAVQVLVMPNTVSYTEKFTSAPKYFDPPAAGTWTYNGSYSGTAPAGGAAIVNIDLGLALGMKPGTFALQPSSSLEITAVMKQVWPRAGVVYDMFGTGQFNFAALFVDTQQVVLGHYTTAGGWVYDAVASYGLNSGKSYTLDLLANGNTVNLSVNGTLALTYTYGTLVTAGKFGLLTVNGTTWFTSVQTQTNDPAFQMTANGTPTLLQMEAEPAPATPAGVTTLTNEQLAPIVVEAKQLWAKALGSGDVHLSALNNVSVAVGDLGPGLLGETTGNSILIDRSAAGWGWFVDSSPQDNSEFSITLSGGALAANASSPAAGKIDLLSTVLHELGNAMGFPEDQGIDVTGMTLKAGVRALPTAAVTQSLAAQPGVLSADASSVPTSDFGGAEGSSLTLPLSAALPIGTPPVSGIVVGPAPVRSAVNQPQPINLGGSRADLGLAPGWSVNGTGGLPISAPLPDDEAPLNGSHSSNGPVISWNSDGVASLEGLASHSTGTSQEWLDDFLNHLGNGATSNPNAGIRVLPTQARM